MSRSFINLRRALFGTSCAIVFGFGATQALSWPLPPGGLDADNCTEWYCDEYCLQNYGEGGSCSRTGCLCT